MSRSSFYEFEDLVATVEDATWIVPQWDSPESSGSFSSRLVSRVLKWQGLELRRIPRVQPVPLNGHWDLMVFFCLTENDLKQLRYMPQWRRHCSRAVVWIGEMWLRKVEKFAADLRLFDNFDEIFLDFGETAEVLSKRLRRPVHYLPFGVDTQRFSPLPDAPERTIDMLSVGRRSDANHAALLDYERRMGIHYQYDATWLTDVHDFADHRRQLIHRIQRAKCFLVGPAKLNVPEQTLGQSELSARYLEGAAAGAALIGESPRAAQFQDLFDWPDAIVEWDMYSDDSSALHSLLQNPARLRRIHNTNVVQCLRRHDWIHRWEDVLSKLGYALSPTGEARKQLLSERADELMSPSHPHANFAEKVR
ncbi:MAG: glycosyltransferase [Planctomycetales bacterium]|nr:glycosyltransferase [Planctomycetales bacterium]